MRPKEVFRTDPIQVIHYISAFFPRPLGAAFSARALARGLRDQGVGIEFIVDEQSGDWESGGEYEGFPIRSFSLSPPGKLKKLRGLWRASRYVWSRRGQVDILHIHGGDFVTIFAGSWLGRLAGANVMLKITSNGLDTPEGIEQGRYGWLVAKLYKRLDGVVAMTSGQAEKTRNWGYPGFIATIPNGVDTHRFVPVSAAEKSRLRQKLGLPVDVPVMCYSGWLGPGKGSDVLLDTWRKVRESMPDTHLLLMGNFFRSKKDRETFSAWLEEVGLDPGILDDPQLVDAGMTEHPEQVLVAADVFMFPSWQEGFGTVQIEAMACGLPCVVHELPGVNTDIFPDEAAGIRIQENQSEGYARTIVDLFADPGRRKRMGSQARERAVEHFDQANIVNQYADFYAQLVRSS